MKKEIEFTTYYNLLTRIMSEVHPNKTTEQVAKEVQSESEGKKKHDMSSVYANMYVYVLPQISQMEAMRADIYMSVVYRLLKAFNDEDANIETFENYARHLVGLDKFVLKMDVEKDEYTLGFSWELEDNQYAPIRIQLLIDSCKSLLSNDIEKIYPTERLRDMMNVFIKAGSNLKGASASLNEALRILLDNQNFSAN